MGPGAVSLNSLLEVCRCGDSTIGCDEQCDDGDTTNGDGCDDFCQCDAQCADGNAGNNAGCSNLCPHP